MRGKYLCVDGDYVNQVYLRYKNLLRMRGKYSILSVADALTAQGSLTNGDWQTRSL